VITSARLLLNGKHASGISITFSKLMAAATVGNVNNDSVASTHRFIPPLNISNSNYFGR
jgi:hypothetical protein